MFNMSHTGPGEYLNFTKSTEQLIITFLTNFDKENLYSGGISRAGNKNRKVISICMRNCELLF